MLVLHIAQFVYVIIAALFYLAGRLGNAERDEPFVSEHMLILVSVLWPALIVYKCVFGKAMFDMDEDNV
jgi:hypothetical protein